jgi:hypothetical protein
MPDKEGRHSVKKLIMLISMLVLLAGCATVRTDYAPLQFGATAAKTSGDILLTTGDINRPYKELGVIFVKGRHVGYQGVMEKLKERAQEAGADAVIKIEFSSRYFYFHRPFCRGVAVSFNVK